MCVRYGAFMRASQQISSLILVIFLLLLPRGGTNTINTINSSSWSSSRWSSNSSGSGSRSSSGAAGVVYQLLLSNNTRSRSQCALDTPTLTFTVKSRGQCALSCTQHVTSGDCCKHFNVIQSLGPDGVNVISCELFLFSPTVFGQTPDCLHFQRPSRISSSATVQASWSPTAIPTTAGTTPSFAPAEMGNTSVCPAKYVQGVALCSDLLYVICWHSRTLHILNVTTLAPLTTLTLPAPLTYPWDISFGVDQTLTRRLYIIDHSAIVYRIDVNASGFPLPGSVWNSTQTPATYNATYESNTLSITPDGRVVVPFPKPGNQLLMYDSLMNSLFNISLPADASNPAHAMQVFANGTLYVLDQKSPAPNNPYTVSGLCSNGTTVCSAYVCPYTSDLKHMTIDEDGLVYVADFGLYRLLVLTPDLSTVYSEIAYSTSEKPYRLSYDRQSGLLAVGIWALTGYSDIRIYQIDA